MQQWTGCLRGYTTVSVGSMHGAGRCILLWWVQAAAARSCSCLPLPLPSSIDGKPTTESNAAFDAALRARNPEWGYRDVADVAAGAAEAGMQLVERRDMPANNFMLVFHKD